MPHIIWSTLIRPSTSPFHTATPLGSERAQFSLTLVVRGWTRYHLGRLRLLQGIHAVHACNTVPRSHTFQDTLALLTLRSSGTFEHVCHKPQQRLLSRRGVRVEAYT